MWHHSNLKGILNHFTRVLPVSNKIHQAFSFKNILVHVTAHCRHLTLKQWLTRYGQRDIHLKVLEEAAWVGSGWRGFWKPQWSCSPVVCQSLVIPEAHLKYLEHRDTVQHSLRILQHCSDGPTYTKTWVSLKDIDYFINFSSCLLLCNKWLQNCTLTDTRAQSIDGLYSLGLV